MKGWGAVFQETARRELDGQPGATAALNPSRLVPRSCCTTQGPLSESPQRLCCQNSGRNSFFSILVSNQPLSRMHRIRAGAGTHSRMSTARHMSKAVRGIEAGSRGHELQHGPKKDCDMYSNAIKQNSTTWNRASATIRLCVSVPVAPRCRIAGLQN